MIKKILHRTIAHAWIYDIFHIPFKKKIYGHTKNLLDKLDSSIIKHPKCVFDVGGGTAGASTLFPTAKHYVNFDLDVNYLVHSQKTHLIDGFHAVLGNALNPAFADNSFEIVICQQVSHHLTENHFQQLAAQIKRVINSNGYFIFIDAVKNPINRFSETMWKIDIGAYPHTSSWICNEIRRHFDIENHIKFTWIYDWLIICAKPRNG
jgi:SAM-dependent methyltransferase